MSLATEPRSDIPAWQQAIRNRCMHPAGRFLPFPEEETNQSIPNRFEKQVRFHGERLALKTDAATLTYNELNRDSNHLASTMLELSGSGPGQVGVLLAQSVELLTALLGVFKSGNVYVPLDPSLPSHRLSYIAEQSQLRLVVSNQKSLAVAKEFTRGRIPIINVDDLDGRLSSENPDVGTPPDGLAGIFYTSGSTGRPKGVMQTHRNVLRYVSYYTHRFGVCPEDRFCMVPNAATFGLVLPLMAGAALCPLDLKLKHPEYLTAWLARHNVTICCTVPTVFRRFTAAISPDDALPDLRLIYMSGEPVLKTDFELYRQRLPEHCLFVNRLGSTETDCMGLFFADKQTQIDTSTVPVGYPPAGKQTRILSEHGEQAPPGEVGEICVKGRVLSPGYWRRPDLTAAVFVENEDGERSYRTGDLGLTLPDGCLVHMGRKDFQVKVRGFRVELPEIESALLEMGGIKDVAVIARQDEFGEYRLIAYFVPSSDDGLSTSTLRRFLADRLPDYMVPAVFVEMASFPYAPTGKILRRQLPPPESVRPKLDAVFRAPRTPVEEKLAQIWATVLGLDEVGVNDHFLDLGGDSLRGNQVMSRINEVFNVELEVAFLFEHPTIASLAEGLGQKP